MMGFVSFYLTYAGCFAHRSKPDHIETMDVA